MIYVTGDTHGDIRRFYSTYPGEYNRTCVNKLKAGDKLIVCGDFGFVFYREDSEYYEDEMLALEYLKKLPYEVLFVSGNHENFVRLKQYPTEVRYGGNVKRINDNVFLLMRGQCFEIEGKTFFTMGGAYSVDKKYRTENIDWWSDELPNSEEYRTAAETLERINYEVDYIITHTAPQAMIQRMGCTPNYHDSELTGFLDWIWYEVDFKHWYFGHWHEDRQIDYKATVCLYEQHLIE